MRDFVWLAVYVGIVVRLTWPLAAHLTTHLPRPNTICDFDQLQMIWALAHACRRLVTDPARLFEANIYHPVQHALLYAESGLGAVPFFLPTFLATGNPILASNVMLIGSVALTAWGLHLLLARWTGFAGAGVAAAAAFLMTPWVLWTWAPGAPNYAVLQWVPLVVWLAAGAQPSRGRTVALGLVLALQGATSPYVAAGVLAPVGVLALAHLARSRDRARGLAIVRALAIAVTLLLVVYGGYAWIRWREPTMPQHTWWPGGTFRAFAFPSDLFFARHRPNAVPFATFLLIGAGAAGAAFRWVRRTSTEGDAVAWRHGALWAVTGLLVSLPPTLLWFGSPIELPHVRLLQRTPLFDLMREPQRMGVASLFGLAILAGAAYAALARALSLVPGLRPGLSRVGLAVLVVGGDYFTYRSVAWPPSSFGAPVLPARYPLLHPTPLSAAIVEALRTDGGVVLQLPAKRPARLKTVAVNAEAMLASIAHGRPILNGYGGYHPSDFPATLALTARLPDPAALAELRRRTGVTRVLVRGERTVADQRAAFEAIARAGTGSGLALAARDGPDLLFTVTDPTDGTP